MKIVSYLKASEKMMINTSEPADELAITIQLGLWMHFSPSKPQ